MDVDEAVRRLRVNLAVIALGIAAGLAAMGIIRTGGTEQFRAAARLVLEGSEPGDTGRSQVIADTGLGIVASPGRVAAALRTIGAERDPEAFARKNVRLSAVGNSVILELSVVDRDPVVAAGMANALADELILARQGIAQTRVADLLRELGDQIAEQVALAQTLEAALPGAGGSRGLSPVLERYREALRRQGDLEAARRRLLEDSASRLKATVIDRASIPSTPESSALLPDLILGALLGLVLGIGLAAGRETIRPTVAGERSIAQLVGAPALGRLSSAPTLAHDDLVAVIAARARLAAEAAGVRTLALTETGQGLDLGELAKRLEDAIHREDPGVHLVSSETRPPIRVTSADGEDLRPLRESPSTVGLVLVTPEVIQRRRLDAFFDLRSMTGWQLLGVITYRKDRHPSKDRVARAARRVSERAETEALTKPPGRGEAAALAEESASLGSPMDDPHLASASQRRQAVAGPAEDGRRVDAAAVEKPRKAAIADDRTEVVAAHTVAADEDVRSRVAGQPTDLVVAADEGSSAADETLAAEAKEWIRSAWDGASPAAKRAFAEWAGWPPEDRLDLSRLDAHAEEMRRKVLGPIDLDPPSADPVTVVRLGRDDADEIAEALATTNREGMPEFSRFDSDAEARRDA